MADDQSALSSLLDVIFSAFSSDESSSPDPIHGYSTFSNMSFMDPLADQAVRHAEASADSALGLVSNLKTELEKEKEKNRGSDSKGKQSGVDPMLMAMFMQSGNAVANQLFGKDDKQTIVIPGGGR